MSESAKVATVGQRYLPRDRESFFDAQRRNRRATWRLSALCVAAAVLMGIPLALIVTPLIYAVVLIVADIINYFQPLPAAFWHLAAEIARFGFVALGWLLQHKPADPQALAVGAAVMLLPGVLLSVLLWMAISVLFHRSGVGGALLALNAREPNQAELRELQLADVVQEMAIAAGLPAPRVMLVDSAGANAAAIGTSAADARIIVSRRLVDDLNRDELEGVCAHLIASIGNGDLRIAFRITAVFETCGLLVAVINSPFGPQSRRVLWRILRYGLWGSGRNGGMQEAAAVADVLSRSVALDADDIDRFFDPAKKSRLRSIRNFIFFPIFFTNFAIKLALWFFSSVILGPSMALLWHTRQYLADASAVQLTRNPDCLAAALQKLNEEPGEIPGGDWAAHLFVVSPKHSGAATVPDARQRQVLAQAWAASEPRPGAAVAPPVPADFRAMQSQFSATLRAALGGDAQAMGRIRALYQTVAAADPAFAAQFPNPDDVMGARHGNAAAIARLLASHKTGSERQPRGPSQAPNAESPSSISSVSMLGFHPSLKRRLKRLARMGAHADIAATSRKAWMVAFVFALFFAPFAVLLVGMFLFLLAMMTMTSLTFLVVWLAFIHKAFTLLGHG